MAATEERAPAAKAAYENALRAFMSELLAGLTPADARSLCPSAREHSGVLLFDEPVAIGAYRVEEGCRVRVVLEFGKVEGKRSLSSDPSFEGAVRIAPQPWEGAVSKGPVELKWSVDVVKRAYIAAMKIHEASGQRLATMLVLAAFIIDAHSRMVTSGTEETVGLVRGLIADLHRRVPL